jgi:eukaryotic-like serine/threonine-protein kinase
MAPPVQYTPGQVLAGTVYRVVRHLATGGMGSVYDVEDTTVEKRYVLKTLHPQLVSREDLARRMRDEAKSLAKLQHPNIVDVITAGVTKDAVKMPFYVMERLIGQNLRVVLEKKSILETIPALRIAIDVADALEHAHENAIVHRDVKPENIFLHRNSNGTTTTKLLDFGIVRLLDRKTSHTHGKFIGTLRYASPEQIMGNPVGPATDIYSLGLVLYEMLAGRGPFDDAGDQYAIGAAHAGQSPPSLTHFVRVQPALGALVDATLAKKPDDRPRDCFAFASELRQILAAEEASPKSATMINVLTTAAADGEPTVGMVSSPPITAPPVTPTRIDEDAPARAARECPPITSEQVSPIAPTLAAAGAPAEVALARSPAPPPAGIGIDREAATRASTGSGYTQRMSRGDTRIEEPAAFGLSPPPPDRVSGPGPDLATDDAVRAAFGAPAPLVVPSLAGSHPSGGDLVFPRMHSSVTGPMAGEARTRPPERGPLVLLGAAVVLTAVMVGGVFVALRARREPRVEAVGAPPPATLPAPTPRPAEVPALPGSVVSVPPASVAIPVAATLPGGNAGAASANPNPPARATPARSAGKPGPGGQVPAVSFDP